MKINFHNGYCGCDHEEEFDDYIADCGFEIAKREEEE